MLWPPCRLDLISVPAAPNTLGEEGEGGEGEDRWRKGKRSTEMNVEVGGCFQAINSIMKLAISEPHGRHNSMAAHTLSSVEDLSFNLALAYAKYFHNLMSMPTYGRELKHEVDMSACSSKQSMDDGSPVDKSSPKASGVHFLNSLH